MQLGQAWMPFYNFQRGRFYDPVLLHGQPGHQVTYRRFGTLIQVGLLFLQAIITSSSTRVINDLMQMVISQEPIRSEEHTSELKSLMRISYAVFCLKKKKITSINHIQP